MLAKVITKINKDKIRFYKAVTKFVAAFNTMIIIKTRLFYIMSKSVILYNHKLKIKQEEVL